MRGSGSLAQSPPPTHRAGPVASPGGAPKHLPSPPPNPGGAEGVGRAAEGSRCEEGPQDLAVQPAGHGRPHLPITPCLLLRGLESQSQPGIKRAKAYFSSKEGKIFPQGTELPWDCGKSLTLRTENRIAPFPIRHVGRWEAARAELEKPWPGLMVHGEDMSQQGQWGRYQTPTLPLFVRPLTLPPIPSSSRHPPSSPIHPPFIHSSSHPPPHPSYIHSFIHSSIRPFKHRSVYLLTHPSIYPRSTHPSSILSILCPSSIHPPIHALIHSYIYPCVSPHIYSLIHHPSILSSVLRRLFIYLLIHLAIFLSTYSPIHTPIYSSIIYQSFYLFIHLPIYPRTHHVFILLFIH